VIYQQRNELLESSDISETTSAMREGAVNDTVSVYIPPDSVDEQWDAAGLEKALAAEFTLQVPVTQWLKADESLDEEQVRQKIREAAHAHYNSKLAQVEREALHHFERAVMLQTLDNHWREHLAALDHLRQGIHLRGYAQKNPKQEYKREAFELFSTMVDSVRNEVTRILMTVQIRGEEDVAAVEEPVELHNVSYQHADYNSSMAQEEEPEGVEAAVATAPKPQPFVRQGDKVGRNDPCPCGSGKKYKQCHGRLG
jgi:preprotein translocase subunit SecA